MYQSHSLEGGWLAWFPPPPTLPHPDSVPGGVSDCSLDPRRKRYSVDPLLCSQQRQRKILKSRCYYDSHHKRSEAHLLEMLLEILGVSPAHQQWKVKVYRGTLHKNEQIIISLLVGGGYPQDILHRKTNPNNRLLKANLFTVSTAFPPLVDPVNMGICMRHVKTRAWRSRDWMSLISLLDFCKSPYTTGLVYLHT